MPEELKFWFIHPFYYFIVVRNGVEIVVQFDKDYWFEIHPGTDFYRTKKVSLRKLQPIGYSVGYDALKKHIAHCLQPFTVNQQEAA